MSVFSLPSLPGLHEHADDTMHTLAARLERVRQIQDAYAGPIIAAGVLSDHDEWTDVTARLGDATSIDEDAALQQFLKTAEQAGVLMWVGAPAAHDGKAHIEDVIAAVRCAHGEAGFLLGLAVGMRLGPDAFAGATAAVTATRPSAAAAGSARRRAPKRSASARAKARRVQP